MKKLTKVRLKLEYKAWCISSALVDRGASVKPFPTVHLVAQSLGLHVLYAHKPFSSDAPTNLARSMKSEGKIFYGKEIDQQDREEQEE